MRLCVAVRRFAISAAILTLGGCLFANGQSVSTPPGMEDQSPPSPPPPPLQPAVSPTSTPATDAELPGAIYRDAMHPLDVVRQSIDNWSESELAALSIGIHVAHEACDKLNPEDYSGDNLYDLARLCALGQDWNPANTAAQLYIRSRAPEHQAQAFAISVGAFVHIGASDLALATTRGMMRGMPYDAEVAYTVR